MAAAAAFVAAPAVVPLVPALPEDALPAAALVLAPVVADVPKSWDDFGMESGSKEFRIKTQAVAVETHELAAWPAAALSSSSTRNLRHMLWRREFPIPDLAPYGTMVQLYEALQQQYRDAVALYGKEDPETKLCDFKEYANALRKMPIPLNLDPSVDLKDAFVQFAIRPSKQDVNANLELVIFLSNLPNLTGKQAAKLTLTTFCLLKATPDPDEPRTKYKWDPRDNAKAAQMLLEYLGGDLYLMRTVVDKNGAAKKMPAIQLGGASEHRREQHDHMEWFKANAEWDEADPGLFATWRGIFYYPKADLDQPPPASFSPLFTDRPVRLFFTTRSKKTSCSYAYKTLRVDELMSSVVSGKVRSAPSRHPSLISLRPKSATIIKRCFHGLPRGVVLRTRQWPNCWPTASPN